MTGMRSKRTKESGDTDDTSERGTMTELLKFFYGRKRRRKTTLGIRDQQFLKIIEAIIITTKGQDEDKRREEIRIAEARERDEGLSEERKIIAEHLQKEEARERQEVMV